MKLLDRFFPNLDDETKQLVLEEWVSFQVDPNLNNDGEEELDSWWLRTLGTKSPSGQARFENLRILVSTLLVLPYDQAPVERVFSMVNKLHTKYRSSLSNETLCALLKIKVNHPGDYQCKNLMPTKQLLERVKTASSRKNGLLADE